MHLYYIPFQLPDTDYTGGDILLLDKDFDPFDLVGMLDTKDFDEDEDYPYDC